MAIGAGVFAVGTAEPRAPQPVTRVISTPEQKTFAYNAFEFTYRSDFGKVILLQQNVETGQAVTQVPTEYHLRQYAATQREQRVQLQQKLYKGAGGESEPAAQTVVVSEPAVSTGAPAASPPASPSVAPSTVAAAAVAHVDIKA